MVYKIDYTNKNKTPILINDGTLDNSTDLTLIGKSFQGGFGDIVAENFLHLLENFSKSTPPERPIEGQLWYDSQNGQLMVYTANGIWKATSGVVVSPNQPVVGIGQTNGDLWVNTNTKQIYMFFENSWNTIGNADQTTRTVSNIRTDTNGNSHKTLEIVVNNKTIAVFSGSNLSWIPKSSGETIERLADNTIMVLSYPVIRPGLNLFNRKNIPDVTINVYPPNTTSENIRPGDFWYSTSTREFYIYKEQNVWEKISYDVKIETANPTVTTNFMSGQFWVNKNTNNIFVFDGALNQWLKVSEFIPNTKIVSKIRTDTLGNTHEVLETIIEGKTVSIDSTTDAFWIPASNQLLEDNTPMTTYFPRIGSGKNYLIDNSYINYDPLTNTVSGAEPGQVPVIRGIADRIRYFGSHQRRIDARTITSSSTLENIQLYEVARLSFDETYKQDVPILFVDFTLTFSYSEVANYKFSLRRVQGNGINEINSRPGFTVATTEQNENGFMQYSTRILDLPNYIYTVPDSTIELEYILEVGYVPKEDAESPQFTVIETVMDVSRFALGV